MRNVRQVNKEKLHRSGRGNCGHSFLTSGFLAISEQVPPPEQESTLGASGYASLSDKVERAVPQGKTDDIEDKKCVQTKISITFVFSRNIYNPSPIISPSSSPETSTILLLFSPSLRSSTSNNRASERSSARQRRVGEERVQGISHKVQARSRNSITRSTSTSDSRWDVLSRNLIQQARDTSW